MKTTVKSIKLVTFKTGKLDSNAAVENGLYPFFTCSQETFAINKYAFDTECVLLAGNNAAGVFPLKYYKGKFNAYQRTYLIEPIDKNILNIRYFYYYLRPLLSEFQQQATGATTKFLTLKILNNLDVYTPSIKNQKKIAAILSTYDDLIKNNKRRINLLDKMAEEIYREWFVRFRFPGYQTAEFEKGIPKGWEVKRLEDISDIISSKRIFLSDYVNEGIPFYRSKEVIEQFNGSEPSSPLYISEEKFLQIDAKFGSPKENDILLTAVGTLGIPLIVKKSDKFYFKDGNLIWFKSKNITHNKFLYFWMQTPQGKGSLLETSIGSSQQAFTIAGLKKIEILLPDSHTLNKFMVMFDAIYTQKQNLISSTNNLGKTKAMLLPRLISGKLSVENLDIQFPPSMQEDQAA